ncbi:unnamed protein product [Phytomonas sp. EM1]|nr:unnamed protein product [Phytomonas sp. EM1]|eukprot:CCW64687.1 unnamed protein product [Phytomonas sp. isolate EM1]
MQIKFTPAVEKAIAEVFPPRDTFDSSTFDPIEYLNNHFPDEYSLSELPAFCEENKKRLRKAENELLKAVEAQTVNAMNSDKDLRNARTAVADLYDRVADIKAKATKSEITIKDMCQHIYELDIAKKNLTASINTLRSVQLWMLQLQALSSSFERHKFTQCRDALEEAQRYAAQFTSMKNIPKVKELNDKQTQLCQRIEYYIRHTIFGDIRLENIDTDVMAKACAIVDLMGPNSIKKIRDRFVEKSLEPYILRFKRGTDDSRLERTERRYVYIRTLLEKYDRVFKNVFPQHWCVPQELCVTFCLRTKQELDYLLQNTAGSIDVVVLMYLLQKTIDIERDMTQMTAWKEDFPGRHELPVYRYNGLILLAFKDHIGIFVENEDKLMREALAQSLVGEGENTCIGWNGEEDVRQGTVLPLADDIFVFIKESLKRTLRISQQDVLLDVAKVWRKHLMSFSRMIMAVLSSPAVSPLDVRRTCIILNTADLCQSTCKGLGEEICARSETPASEVAFEEVVTAFYELYNKSIQAIVLGLEFSLTPLLNEYGNGVFIEDWADSESGAQDESKLIRSIITTLRELVLNCAVVLPTRVLRFLLDKVAARIIPQYRNTLYRLKYLTNEAVGAMRVDSAALEKTFLQLPNYNDPQRFQAHTLTGYMKLVRREFDELNRALRILQVDVFSEAFLEVYYEVSLPEDRSIQNFVRLVELKGRKRDEVRPWIASLSKRGVVEATKRDLVCTESYPIAIGTTSSAVNESGDTEANAAGGLILGMLFS